MGIFDNATGAVDEVADTLGMASGSAAARAFPRDFGTADFDEFGGSTLGGEFTEIARYTVPASTEVAWGYGKASNPENQGYLFVDLMDDSNAAVEGTLRLAQESPTGRTTRVVSDYDTTTLAASKSDRQQRVPLPEQINQPVVTQDSRLVVKFRPAADGTVNEGNSDVIFPVTEYDLTA